MKWFGNVTLGKLGSMYLGDIPLSMNFFRVGVNPRYTKSARKPSNDINMVVGANKDVPFETIVGTERISDGVETRYATERRTTNRTTMLA